MKIDAKNIIIDKKKEQTKVTKPVNIGSEKQLFIDSKYIDKSEGIELVMNSPIKSEMILQSEYPWENYRVTFNSIIDTGKNYLLYYTALYVDESGRFYSNMCMAESLDGIQWTRPELGLFEFQGSKKNNIIGPFLSGAPHYDPFSPFGEPFIMLGTISGLFDPDGLKPPEEIEDPTKITRMKDPVYGMVPNVPYLFSSTDGVYWKRRSGPVIDMACDSCNQIFYDHRINKYVAYLRGFKDKRTVVRYETRNPFDISWVKRKPDATPDGYGFYYITDEMPVVMETDDKDYWPGDIQNPAVLQYPWAKDVYLTVSGLYRWYPGPVKGGVSSNVGSRHRFRFFNDGPNDLHLFTSRNGIKFSRPSRWPYIGLGIWGNDDSGCLLSGLGMLRSNSELWQYYTAFKVTHGAVLSSDRNVAKIYRAVQRLDGFVSVDAGHSGGEFTTPALVFEGSKLELNINCSALGEAWVEIQDDKGRVFLGYAMEDCDPLDLNHTSIQ